MIASQELDELETDASGGLARVLRELASTERLAARSVTSKEAELGARARETARFFEEVASVSDHGNVNWQIRVKVRQLAARRRRLRAGEED